MGSLGDRFKKFFLSTYLAYVLLDTKDRTHQQQGLLIILIYFL